MESFDRKMLDVPVSLKILDHLIPIIRQFKPQGQIIDLQNYGSGNINCTYRVILESVLDSGFPGHPESLILQRLNTTIFPDPIGVMHNIKTLTHHVRQRLALDFLNSPRTETLHERRWEIPQVILTQAGADHWHDPQENSFWRVLSFIDQAQSFDILQDDRHAREVGYALGLFHHLISDLPAQNLVDTLPGFHIAPTYLQQYQKVLATNPPSLQTPSPEVAYGLKFIEERAPWVSVLETAKAEGKLQMRLIHGDPKVNNILMDTTTGLAVSLVDLDTVKPGLVHYDIGDCLRSGCNPLGEETQNWEAVVFDLDRCEAILKGYLGVARQFLNALDLQYLYDGIRLLAFELGLRFFTDYLAGNVYFKVQYPEHNLARALVQFALTQSIEAQAQPIQAMIQDFTTQDASIVS